jgi:hypothetical protein
MQSLYKSSFVVLMASLTAAATASDYTVEGGLSWWDLEGNTAWGGDITVYFSPVIYSNDRPLAEARFLSRAGNLSINYARDTGGDFDLIDGSLELYVDDFYAAIGASRFSNDFDVDSYGLRGGWMITPATRLTGGWERIESSDQTDIDRYTLGAKHVTLLGGGRAINIEGDLGAADNGDTKFTYNLKADYYFSPAFSLGGRYDGIGSEDRYGLGTRYFFTPMLSGEIEWLRDDNRDDTFQLRLGTRF